MTAIPGGNGDGRWQLIAWLRLGRQRLDQQGEVESRVADGGGQVGAVIGREPVGVPVQNDPRLDYHAVVQGIHGVVQDVGAAT